MLDEVGGQRHDPAALTIGMIR